MVDLQGAVYDPCGQTERGEEITMRLSEVGYEIEKIEKKTADEFLKQYHYLGKQGYSFRSGFNYGLFEKGCLVGVCIFHTVSALETVKGAFGISNQEGFWELGRLALDPAHNNTGELTSWFVSRCIKRLRRETNVRALISYADAEYHVGYIYQALNFGYYGLTTKKCDYWKKCEDGTYKKMSRGGSKSIEGEWRPRSRKHRYMLIYDNELTVKWEKQKYPKRRTSTEPVV